MPASFAFIEKRKHYFPKARQLVRVDSRSPKFLQIVEYSRSIKLQQRNTWSLIVWSLPMFQRYRGNPPDSGLEEITIHTRSNQIDRGTRNFTIFFFAPNYERFGGKGKEEGERASNPNFRWKNEGKARDKGADEWISKDNRATRLPFRRPAHRQWLQKYEGRSASWIMTFRLWKNWILSIYFRFQFRPQRYARAICRRCLSVCSRTA